MPAELPGRVMVIAPHPDDETIGCGGLLARAAREGGRSSVLCLAVDDTERVRELYAAAARLSVDDTRILAVGQDEFDRLQDRFVVDWIDRELAAFKPDLLLIPSAAGYHQDHRRGASLAVSAARPRGGRSFGYAPMSVWYYEAPADVSSPTGAWSPTLFVELDAADVAAKTMAMACHASQVRPHPSERSMEALTALATLRGAQVGVPYAEAFAPRRMIL